MTTRTWHAINTTSIKHRHPQHNTTLSTSSAFFYKKNIYKKISLKYVCDSAILYPFISRHFYTHFFASRLELYIFTSFFSKPRIFLILSPIFSIIPPTEWSMVLIILINFNRNCLGNAIFSLRVLLKFN